MLGILGLGSHTTTYYIQEINRLYQKEQGGYSTMPFKMLNSNFNDLNPYLPNQFDELIPRTDAYLMRISALDVDKILVPNITLHQTIDQLELTDDLRNKLFHPVQISANKLKLYGVKEVVLFGSIYSMQSNYISNVFKRYGVSVCQPTKQDQEKIDLIRRSAYEIGKSDLLDSQISAIAENYADKSILLACTELTLLHGSIPQAFDMVKLQLEEVLAYYSA